MDWIYFIAGLAVSVLLLASYRGAVWLLQKRRLSRSERDRYKAALFEIMTNKNRAFDYKIAFDALVWHVPESQLPPHPGS